ncbi:hypothetical protein F5X68DRAFT_47191 [Plectosphaerella plurivora]|uniref:DUF7708 domain-containing protein n=1 Tax=Plectosphaerella plurivora TaxID=936078 RepID=A0A9P8VL69_9PEZI|nr:hypothetical protein F5X68DRAFT_47191 [Plectosphaerella plurivora]
MTSVPDSDAMKDAAQVDYSRLYADCFAARDAFHETANCYLLKRGRPPFAASTASSSQVNSWADVEATVTQACKSLDNLAGESEAVQGFTGRLRRAYRALCSNSGTVSCYLDLVPSDMMISSTLRGALQLVFTAMESSANHRQAVFAALEEIPIILTDRAATLNIFASDEALHVRMAALYVEMLGVLRHIVKYFTKNSFTSELKNFVMPTAAEQRLNEHVARLKLRADEFKERVLVLSQLSQVESLGLQRDARDMQKEGLDLHRETLDRVQKIDTKLEYFRREYERKVVLHDISKNFKPVPATTQAVEVRPPRDTPVPASRPAPPAVLGPAAIHVLKIFQYDLDPLLQDIRQIQRGRRDLFPTDSRASYLANSARLQAWLAIDRPSLLLVNGGGTNSAAVDVSIVSAGLVSTLLAAATAQPQIVPLAFFCGQHKQFASDVYGCAVEMTMSLLLQLIHRYARFSDEELAEIVHRTNPRDIMSVCDTLEACVRRLSADTTLFIVLDGIDCFSDPTDRAHETIQVVHRLIGLSKQPPATSLKFLFVGSTRSRFIEHLVTDSEIMNIPMGVF